MEARRLQAFIDQQKVGELQDENGIWRFLYHAPWVLNAEGFGLSPALPKQAAPITDGGSLRPVQWYFDNLLPEEGARYLLAKDAHLHIEDAFGLLSAYGAESAGSLTLVSEKPSAEHGTTPLGDEQLQARIEQLPRVPLTHGAAKRMSLAGVQHKLAVIFRAGELLEPVGNTPSTHILKPNHSDSDYPHSVINEYFTMRLAKSLRLDVPRVLRRYVPAPIYLVERFDRRSEGDVVKRLHLIDACQALNLDRQFKYRGGSVERLRDLADRCAVPVAAKLKLFQWLIFNLLVGNSDAHLKNISFLVDARGVRLAPFYDMLAVGVYGSNAFQKREWPKTALAFPLAGCGSFQEVTVQALLDIASVFGIRAATARRLIQEQVSRIEANADELLQEIEAENSELSANHPGLAASLGGEMRCVRAVAKVVIHDMVARLS